MRIPVTHYWQLLSTYLLKHKPLLAILATLLPATVATQLLNPQIARSFIDSARGGAALDALVLAALLYLAIGILTQVLAVATTYTSTNIGWQATNRLRADLAEHVLSLDMQFYTAHTPGELLERVDGDVRQLANFFSLFVVDVVGNMLLLVGVLVALALADLGVGLAFVVFACSALLLLYRLRHATASDWHDARAATAALYSTMEERLAAVADIRPNGAIAYSMHRFYELGRRQFALQRAAGVRSQAVFSAGALFLTAGSVVAFALGAWLYLQGSLTLGTMFLIVNYAALLVQPLRVLIRQVDDLQKATACIARVRELQQRTPSIAGGTGRLGAPAALSVELRNVSFAYGADTPVLRDVSLTLGAGEVLGVIGRTGSGKSTLARLLLRLYDPTAGEIRLNGTGLSELALADVRRHVAMVAQEGSLFQATVRNNVALFDARIPDARIEQTLNEVGLGAWLAALDRGLDTELALGGAGLSAGQAQLLALSRVFLRSPGLLVMDEASSRLDPATERQIEAAIDRLLRGRTAVIIAHRLTTVLRADWILLLDGGRVAEYGRRSELAADPSSRFARLLRTSMQQVLA